MTLTDAEFLSDALRQRNEAWAEIETLKSRLAAIEGHIAKYEDAIHAEIDEGSYYVETGHSCSCCPQEYNYADPGEFLAAIQLRLNS